MAGGLIERDAERARLESVFESTAAGMGRFVLIGGNGGFGKSELLRWGAARATDFGLRTFTARATEWASTEAFGVARQLFENVDGLSIPQSASAVRAIFEAAPLGLDASYSAMNALYWLCADLSDIAPTVLIVDDLQWCDTSSLQFLAYMVPRLGELPLTVIAAARLGSHNAENHLLQKLELSAKEDGWYLRPLSIAGSTDLLRTAISPDLSDDFCIACHDATNGIPFRLTQIAQAVRDEQLEPAGCTSADAQRLATRLMSERIERWVATCGLAGPAVASALAVLGEAPVDVVAAVAATTQSETTKTIEILAAADIVALTPDPSYAHPLIHAAAYGALNSRTKQRLHAVAATVLDDRGSDPQQVAGHILNASVVDLAIAERCLTAAARKAAAGGAPAMAARYLRRLLEEELPTEVEIRTLCELGMICAAIDLDEAHSHLARAAELETDAAKKGAIYERLGSVLTWQAKPREAIDVRRSGLSCLGSEDPSLQQELLAGIGHAAILMDKQAWQPVLAEAERVTPDAGPGGHALNSFVALCHAFSTDSIELARTRAYDALADGMLVEVANGSEQWCDAVLALALTDLQASSQFVVDAVEHARRIGSPFAMAVTGLLLGLCHYLAGDLIDADAALVESVEAAQFGNLEVSRPAWAIHAWVHADRGSYDLGFALLDSICDAGEVPTTEASWWWYLYGRAHLLLEAGMFDSGADAMLACGANFSRHGWTNPALIPWRSEAGVGLLRLGRVAEATALIEDEFVLAQASRNRVAIGRCLRAQAVLQPPEERTALLCESAQMLDGSSKVELARSLLDLGRCVASIGGDCEDARGHLQRSMDVADACGAAGIAARARKALVQTGAKPRRARASGPGSLTPSELRIATMVAEGTTNRVVAQELFLTTKTVETHLTSIYRKLRIGGRHELAPALLARST